MGNNLTRQAFKDLVSPICEYEYQAELLARYIENSVEKRAATKEILETISDVTGRRRIAGHRRYKRGVAKVKATYGVRRTPELLIIVSKTARLASYLFDETAKLYSKIHMPCRYFPHILRIAGTYQNMKFITDAEYERHYQYGYHNAQFVFGEAYAKSLDMVSEYWG